MKTKITSIAAVMFAAILFSSCTKLEKVLVKKEGTWNVATFQMKQTLNGTVFMDTTYNDWGTMMFKDDGTGTASPSDTATFGGAENFTWTAEEGDDHDHLTLIIGTAPDQDTIEFSVEELEKKSMTLHFSETDTTGGMTSVFEQTFNMERAE